MTVTNKQIAAQFRRAKGVLWDGVGVIPRMKHKFICHALTGGPRCDDTYEMASQAAYAAKAIVMGRLRGYYTLEEWLQGRGVQACDLYANGVDSRKKIMRTRVRWLNSLIAEFEANSGGK